MAISSLRYVTSRTLVISSSIKKTIKNSVTDSASNTVKNGLFINSSKLFMNGERAVNSLG